MLNINTLKVGEIVKKAKYNNPLSSVPKVEFTYSWIYDQHWAYFVNSVKNDGKYPTNKKTLKYISCYIFN